VLKIHAEHGIVTEAYGPLTPVVRHPDGGPLRPILSRIAQRLTKETGKGVDDTNVLLLWTKATGVIAVSASGSPENIKQIALTQTLPDLTPEEVKEITEAGRKIHFRHYVRARTVGVGA
jgi:diketogulonate reductase-like aldo/keto reductase